MPDALRVVLEGCFWSWRDSGRLSSVFECDLEHTYTGDLALYGKPFQLLSLEVGPRAWEAEAFAYDSIA